MKKIGTLICCLWGYVLKFLYDIKFLKIPKLGDTRQADVIVSLTSYGRRVSSCVVFYTIASLLRQQVQPKRIILWLAENEWSDTELPEKLLQLKGKGLEIRYCKDIRSYKKLIPTIELCPNEDIITVDDDLIYSSDTIMYLYNTHIKYPNDIICLNANNPIIINGCPSFYECWKSTKRDNSGLLIFPIGVGGIYYPQGSLCPEVVRDDLFMKLCPLADDIWFWFNGLRNSTNKQYVTKKKRNYSFDDIYQYLHKGSALTHTNCEGHQNNIQFANLFKHYGVIISEENKMVSKTV